MLDNARLTVAAGVGPNRAKEAERQIHAAMYRFALGQITDEERGQILAILQPCCPEMFFSQPTLDDPHVGTARLDWEQHLQPPPT
jgi:hypothetical protein